MAMIDDYTVTSGAWATIASLDAFGDPTNAAATNIKVKVEYSERLFKSPRDGSKRVSNVQIYSNSSNAFVIGQKVTLSSVDYTIEFIESNDMFEVADHKLCYLIANNPG